MERRSVSERAEAAVRAVLPPSVSVKTSGAESSFDMVVHGRGIQVKWLGEGGLRQAREVVGAGRGLPDVVAARHLSPGARAALSEAGVAWVDETGAAEIVLGSLIVSKSGHVAPPREREARWTPAVLAVAEALLFGRKATVAAIEEATGLSAGACTGALGALTRLGLLESEARRGRNSARRMADADCMLEAYAAASAARRREPSVRVGGAWQDVVAGLVETGKRWDRARVAWAVTGAAAASVLAPYLTSVSSAEVYVAAETVPELIAVAARGGLRPIEGGRVTLRPFPTVAVRALTEERSGLRVAPWPRVYADLRVVGVRGEEAAEHLREIELGR